MIGELRRVFLGRVCNWVAEAVQPLGFQNAKVSEGLGGALTWYTGLKDLRPEVRLAFLTASLNSHVVRGSGSDFLLPMRSIYK